MWCHEVGGFYHVVSRNGDFYGGNPVSESMKGKYFHNLDAKGRLIIPAKLRDSIGHKFVITQGFDNCLSAYSQEEWEKFTAKLDGLGNSKKNARMIKMFFRENAYDVEFDSQGRIVIPADLREMAEIVKEVAIVGSGEKIDIWSKENYDELHKQKEFSKEYIMDLLEESDFDF